MLLLKKLSKIVVIAASLGALYLLFFVLLPYFNQQKVLMQIVERLEADSRIAEVIVTDSEMNLQTGKTKTTIKFVEYDVNGVSLMPQYFTFSNNLLQFQSLVIRFSDELIKNANRGKEKSAYIFWKVFYLEGSATEEHQITAMNTVPEGYHLSENASRAEEIWWERFWDYALDEKKRVSVGIKNAQIEAPGTLFLPGKLYTLQIEHDGGIRIDSVDLPSITRGERLPQ